MTEHLPSETNDKVANTEIEITVRLVEELLHSYDPAVIRLAFEVGSSLPFMGVKDEELVAVQSLREQIRMRAISAQSSSNL